MHPAHLIYDAMGRPSVGGDPASLEDCCMCGQSGTLQRDEFIRDSFNNLDSLVRSESPAICAACAWCLSQKSLRTTSWLVDPTRITWLKREDIWAVLFGETNRPAPFAIYVTTSHKKHGFFKTRVNSNWDQYWIQFEEVGLTFEPDRWKSTASNVDELYQAFRKTEIETGYYESGRILRFGGGRWAELESNIAPFRAHPVFEMILHAANRRTA